MFWRERSIIDAWQSSEYLSGSQYFGVLNMPALNKILKKKKKKKKNSISYMLDTNPNIPPVLNMAGLPKVRNKTLCYRFLIGFWIHI